MKPQPPPRPQLHPSTPVQQLTPMLNSYFNQVEAFYNSLVRHVNSDNKNPRESWGTEWAPLEITQEELDAEIDSGVLSPAAIAKLKAMKI